MNLIATIYLKINFVLCMFHKFPWLMTFYFVLSAQHHIKQSSYRMYNLYGICNMYVLDSFRSNNF